ncbi:MAG: FIST C-terminal domain-containing protein [Rhodocyclales bacterium]|nr:FIST C-terminal domain-containing protein [Rhodocyclales bacterium]
MSDKRDIRTGHSCAEAAAAAVAEFDQQIRQPDMALVLFFCSSAYDLPALADEMNRRFAGIPVVGCTTAGEIGPAGYRGQSLSGLSFPAGSCRVAVGGIDGLHSFEIEAGREFAQNLLRRLETQAPDADARNSFGLLLIDGLSLREEPVTHALQDGLGSIHMIGGSAGDDLKFERTWVFHDGAFHTDSAALVLVSTDFPFRILKTQHFVSDGERMVVTEVDAARRVVKEINGLPAIQEYGRIVGVPAEDLMPSHFAAWPVVVMIDGTDFVRSIQHANPDGSLTFYCAIDEGVVLRVAHGKDLLGQLGETIDDLRADLGDLQAMLVCDCILRNLEATRDGSKDAVGDLFRRHNAVGFATYGEQFGGVHVNQTLTGIAIGGGRRADE